MGIISSRSPEEFHYHFLKSRSARKYSFRFVYLKRSLFLLYSQKILFLHKEFSDDSPPNSPPLPQTLTLSLLVFCFAQFLRSILLSVLLLYVMQLYFRLPSRSSFTFQIEYHMSTFLFFPILLNFLVLCFQFLSLFFFQSLYLQIFLVFLLSLFFCWDFPISHMLACLLLSHRPGRVFSLFIIIIFSSLCFSFANFYQFIFFLTDHFLILLSLLISSRQFFDYVLHTQHFNLISLCSFQFDVEISQEFMTMFILSSRPFNLFMSLILNPCVIVPVIQNYLFELFSFISEYFLLLTFYSVTFTNFFCLFL